MDCTRSECWRAPLRCSLPAQPVHWSMTGPSDLHAPRCTGPRVCASRCDPRHRFHEPFVCSSLAWAARGFPREGCLIFRTPATFASAWRAVCNKSDVSTSMCITNCFVGSGRSRGGSNIVTFQNKTCKPCKLLCLKPSVYIFYVSWLAWR